MTPDTPSNPAAQLLESIVQTSALADAVVEMADGDLARAASICDTIRDVVFAKLGEGRLPVFVTSACAVSDLHVEFVEAEKPSAGMH